LIVIIKGHFCEEEIYILEARLACSWTLHMGEWKFTLWAKDKRKILL